METGQYFDKEQRTLSAPLNLIWYVNYTQNIKSIVFTSPAPATPKSSTNG